MPETIFNSVQTNMEKVLLRIGHYLELVKFPHTVFALPFALISFMTALKVHQIHFRWPVLLWVLVCMVSARTAAMAFNRLVDQEIDSRNPRTQGRHLPQGILSVREVWTLVLFCCGVFILACWQINTWTLILSPVALAVVLGYSLTKYFTSLTHFVLGSALALAPLGAWIAASETIGWPPVILAAGVVVWVAGLDILYALQDEEVDRKEGLGSLVVILGRKGALWLSCGLHVLAVLGFLVFGLLADFGWIYYLGLALAGGVLTAEHLMVTPQDIRRVNAAFFTANGLVSVGLFVFTLLEIIWV